MNEALWNHHLTSLAQHAANVQWEAYVESMS